MTEAIDENPVDSLIEELEAINASGKTKGIIRTKQCEIHKVEDTNGFQVYFFNQKIGEEIFFVSISYKTVYKHRIGANGVHQRTHFADQMTNPQSEALALELRDKLAKVTFN